MTRARTAVGALILSLLAAALGVAFVILADDDGDSGGGASTRARPATPPEGSVRVGVPQLPGSYNPFSPGSRTPAATQILSLVLPQLFEVAPDGTVEGRLVDDASVEVDGREVRFRLAEGATWSDGTPITASDLSFTLGVIRSSDWPGPDAGYDLLEAVEGEGRDVTLRFSRRLPGWRRLFSGEDFVLPRHRLDGRDVASVWAAGPDLSGGPYLLEGATPGLNVVLSANPEWWGEGPGVRDIEVLTVPDATTLQQLFERGELEVMWMPAFTERRREMAEIEGVEVSTAEPGGLVLSLYAQTGEVPMETRIAALDLVDRDRFTEVLLAGEAGLATSWGRLERDAGWPQWFTDPAKAREVPDTDLALAIPDEEPMGSLLARAVQRKARPTSLTIDAVTLTNRILDGEWLPEGRFDLALVDEVQWPEPCWRCRFDSAYAGETNWARVGDFDDLAARADAGDAAAASRLERRLEEEGVVLPLWRPAAVTVSRGVANVQANSWSPGPFWRVERWTAGRD